MIKGYLSPDLHFVFFFNVFFSTHRLVHILLELYLRIIWWDALKIALFFFPIPIIKC